MKEGRNDERKEGKKCKKEGKTNRMKQTTYIRSGSGVSV
jgi:hypothetical protein